MHQRSRFLPTITSAIASLGTAAQSPGLKFKLAELKRKIHKSPPPSLSLAVQSHAYRVMHTSLFDAKAARSLRMQVGEGDKKSDAEDDSMIIDGSVFTSERRSPTKACSLNVSDSDFEDMLEDEDEPLSEDETDMLLDLESMPQELLPSRSLRISDFGGQEDLPEAGSLIDLGGQDIEEIKEPEHYSIMEISEKSLVAEDMEQHLLVDNVPMLF